MDADAATEPAPVPSGSLRVTVVDRDDVSIPGVSLYIDCRALVGGPMLVSTDEDGQALVPGLPAGPCRVRTQKAGFQQSPLRAQAVRIDPSRESRLVVMLDAVWCDIGGEDAPPFLEDDARRGSSVPQEELRALPFQSLGGVDGLVRHPGLGAAPVPSDPTRVEGQWWLPQVPEGAVAVVDPEGTRLVWGGRSVLRGSARADLILHPEAGDVGLRGGGLVSGPIVRDDSSLTAAVEVSEEGTPRTFTRLEGGASTNVSGSVFSAGPKVAAGARLLWSGYEAGAQAEGGVLTDVDQPTASRGFGRLGATWIPRGNLSGNASAELLTANADAPLHATVGASATWDATARLALRPAFALRQRGPDVAPEARLDATLGFDDYRESGLFAVLSHRTEGIDSDAEALVTRDEAVLGGGFSFLDSTRLKLSVLGALRGQPTVVLPGDLDVQLALHHPYSQQWSTEATLSWRPEVAGFNDDRAPGEAGALVTWQPWIGGTLRLGAGGQLEVGRGDPRGELAARMGYELPVDRYGLSVALEGAVGGDAPRLALSVTAGAR